MSRVRVLVIAGVVVLQGCGSSWTRYSLAPGEAPDFPPGSEVRVTRTDDRFIVLEGARVVGDSLVGAYGEPPRRWAVATTNIKRLEVRSAEARRSAASAERGVGAAIGGAAIALVVGATLLLVSVLTQWN